LPSRLARLTARVRRPPSPLGRRCHSTLPLAATGGLSSEALGSELSLWQQSLDTLPSATLQHACSHARRLLSPLTNALLNPFVMVVRCPPLPSTHRCVLYCSCTPGTPIAAGMECTILAPWEIAVQVAGRKNLRFCHPDPGLDLVLFTRIYLLDAYYYM
jgi:hypothetical protein